MSYATVNSEHQKAIAKALPVRYDNNKISKTWSYLN